MDNKQLVLTFDGIDDYLEISHDFPLIKNAITIEFWAKGENTLGQQTSILAFSDAVNNRVVNIHLPWKYVSDTRIFWDAGNQNGYDRIEKVVQLQEYNVWTHWAFVKDTSTGKMCIYRNGEIWHEGQGKNKLLLGYKKFFIGCFNRSHYWKGSLAELRIWHQARTQIEIQENMEFSLVGDEPGLSAYLPFNGDAKDKINYNNNPIIYGATWTEESIAIRKQKSQTQQDTQPTQELETSSNVIPEKPAESPSSGKVEQPIGATDSTPNLDAKSETKVEESPASGKVEQPIEATDSTSNLDAKSETKVEESTSNLGAEQSSESVLSKKKRLVICCDGTWHELTSSSPTNVLKFARLVKYTADDRTSQLVFYSSGSSLEYPNLPDLIDRIGDSAFKWGIDRVIQDAYRFLCLNYDAEAQDEIYLIGFSRGAYIARSLAGMIYKCGLLKRSQIQEIKKAYELYRDHKITYDSQQAQEFRQANSQKVSTQTTYLVDHVPIKMLGCWETVGTLGIPDVIPWLAIDKIWNSKYQFDDAILSPIVENAFHAVAIDEKRQVFPSTPLNKSDKNPDQVVEEVWFTGEHSCVGGGNKEYRGLSDYSLQWMIKKAQKLGLDFYSSANDSEDLQIKPDPTTYFDNSVTGIYRLSGEEWRSIETSYVAVHHSVVDRLKACPDYRPENLKPFLNNLLP